MRREVGSCHDAGCGGALLGLPAVYSLGLRMLVPGSGQGRCLQPQPALLAVNSILVVTCLGGPQQRGCCRVAMAMEGWGPVAAWEERSVSRRRLPVSCWGLPPLLLPLHPAKRQRKQLSGCATSASDLGHSHSSSHLSFG
mmetsp:Transcript_40078/g.100625  ORF Transcript_40078/g.100625 Transcript_40078/m.100625 type:complete len:140 (+) Transcript_40078:2256-2675(+)